MVDIRGLDGTALRVTVEAEAGMVDCRRDAAGFGSWLPGVPACRDLDRAVGGAFRPVIMTDDGGELWGVSWPLPNGDLSDKMLETESRSCCPFE